MIKPLNSRFRQNILDKFYGIIQLYLFVSIQNQSQLYLINN